MKLRTFIIISLSSFALFVLTGKISWNLDNPMNEKAIAGKKVWQAYNCVSCHTIFGNGGYVGGDLTQIMSVRSSEYLIEFFNNPPVIPPNQELKHPHLSQKETKDLISYFEYLSTIPTLGWPPEPKEFEGRDAL